MSQCPYEAEAVLARALVANEVADALDLQTYYDFRKIIRSLMYQSAAELIRQPVKPFWFSTTPTPTDFEILYEARLEWYKTFSPLIVPGKQEDGSPVDVPCTIDYGEKYDMHSYHIVAFIRSTDKAIAETLVRNADNYVVAVRVFFDEKDREKTEWRTFKGEGLPQSFGITQELNYNSGHAHLEKVQFSKYTLDEIFALLVELQLDPKKKTTIQGKKLFVVLFVMLGEAQRFPILQHWFSINSQSETLQRLDSEISNLFNDWSKLCKHCFDGYRTELEDDLARENAAAAAAAVQEDAAAVAAAVQEEGAAASVLENDLIIDAAVREGVVEGASDGAEEEFAIDAAAAVQEEDARAADGLEKDLVIAAAFWEGVVEGASDGAEEDFAIDAAAAVQEEDARAADGLEKDLVIAAAVREGVAEGASDGAEEEFAIDAAAAVQEDVPEGASDGLEEYFANDAAAVQEDVPEGASDGLEEYFANDAAAEETRYADAYQHNGSDGEAGTNVGAVRDTERNEDESNKGAGEEASKELDEKEEHEISRKFTEAQFRRKHSRLVDFKSIAGKSLTLLNSDITLVLDILMRKNGYAGRLYITSRRDEPDVFELDVPEGAVTEAAAAAVNQNQGQGVTNSKSTGEGSRRLKPKGWSKGLGAAQPFQGFGHGGESNSNEENSEETGLDAVNQNRESGQGARSAKQKGRRTVDGHGEKSDETGAAAVHHNQGQGGKKDKGRGKVDGNGEKSDETGAAAVHHNQGQGGKKYKGRRNVDGHGEKSDETGAAAVHHNQGRGGKKYKGRRKVDDNGEKSDETGAAAVHHNQGQGGKKYKGRRKMDDNGKKSENDAAALNPNHGQSVKNTQSVVEGGRRPKYVGRRNRLGAEQRFEGLADGSEADSSDDYQLKSASFGNFSVLHDENSEESDPDDAYQQQSCGFGLLREED